MAFRGAATFRRISFYRTTQATAEASSKTAGTNFNCLISRSACRRSVSELEAHLAFCPTEVYNKSVDAID